MSTGRRDPDNPGVVAGPWPGSTTAPVPSRRPPISPPPSRRPIPGRYSDKYGNRQLMSCLKCLTPWAPGVEIPRDRLCTQCRPDDPNQLALIPLSDLTGQKP